MYLIINEVDGCIGEKNGNKYLILIFTDQNKEVLTKHTKLWDGIKNEIVTTNGGKPGKHGKDSMKIKFDSDNSFPLNETQAP